MTSSDLHMYGDERRRNWLYSAIFQRGDEQVVATVKRRGIFDRDMPRRYRAYLLRDGSEVYADTTLMLKVFVAQALREAA